jgi:transposase
MLINAARGLTKSFGERLRRCGAGQAGPTLAAELSAEIRASVLPLLAQVEALNQRNPCFRGATAGVMNNGNQ